MTRDMGWHSVIFCVLWGGGGGKTTKTRTVWGAGGGARCGASTDSHASTPTAKLDRSCRRRANGSKHLSFRHSCPREVHTDTTDKECRSFVACVTREQVKGCFCASITRCATQSSVCFARGETKPRTSLKIRHPLAKPRRTRTPGVDGWLTCPSTAGLLRWQGEDALVGAVHVLVPLLAQLLLGNLPQQGTKGGRQSSS
jgi:hypothetical protein